ncbi:uncharacterized protein EV422DRAFT_243210 [Fimicolochytrium jonesii]|uniref:uncharacterized protein n=1 Tax=Fimicolochytrium jonesii TaxID=1396493 RepID=UPI0022FE99F4|nr:uncharacterized protein EV422DRAFT_243210 [Fimicolochytrium jonesii]KAI8825042.1 hypothetical protein EV422DRAFT_243210 [Fimicolochytrium jonesii]
MWSSPCRRASSRSRIPMALKSVKQSGVPSRWIMICTGIPRDKCRMMSRYSHHNITELLNESISVITRAIPTGGWRLPCNHRQVVHQGREGRKCRLVWLGENAAVRPLKQIEIAASITCVRKWGDLRSSSTAAAKDWPDGVSFREVISQQEVDVATVVVSWFFPLQVGTCPSHAEEDNLLCKQFLNFVDPVRRCSFFGFCDAVYIKSFLADHCRRHGCAV